MGRIRNPPTYDPLSHAEPSTAEVLRDARRVWRRDWLPFVALGALTSLPVAPGLLDDVPVAREVAGQIGQVLLGAVVAPVVSRRLRRLPPDLARAGREALRRLPTFLTCAAVVLGLAAAPSVLAAFLFHTWTAAALALPLGVLIAAPLSMAVPVAAAEGLGVRGSLRRSRRLVQGRLPGAAAVLALSVLAAALPDLAAPAGAGAAGAALFLRPLLAALAALTVGAAYVALYRR
jgi:hypothetical protein